MRVFLQINNYKTFADMVNGNIECYPKITFYTIQEIRARLKTLTLRLLREDVDIYDEYAFQVPLSDTHDKVHWFKCVNYYIKDNTCYIALYYNGTLK